MPRTVQVSAPSRLHFGLLRFAPASGVGFGGIGLMIDSPRVVVVLSKANHWSADGPEAQRALAWARSALEKFLPTAEFALKIQVSACPIPHTGLGTGTQLALAIATAVRALCELPRLPVEEIAPAMGRGLRSAVGSYGFYSGGLILETGQDTTGYLGQLQHRMALPRDWNILLITPPTELGCHGRLEAEAFDQLGAMPESTSQRLLELATKQIVTAAQQNDTATFDQAIYQYGLLSGECFSSVQGGPFASVATARRVAFLRKIGAQGVGQSSWGPTVYALLREDSPDTLIAQLATRPEFADCHFEITAPDNRGAIVTIDGKSS
jgi:beta-ribofuranosylaminobenzene 5'-phosphate synthase